MRISDWSSEVCSSDLKTYATDAAGYGYPGMDDQGATSSWYALSALGFYPVDPSSQEYIIGSPLFDDASLDMGNGKTLRIVARNNSDTNVYIQSATLDRKSTRLNSSH